ncbi:hypothetical protein BpHYR1_026325 [Brachionus plicatilis]|uniref:Uncharacterized protein n=1 Tax=Brachionus plicatilis TaxID=10195 RepID=A0A3M7QQW3_BRAPC|nr:hypothetical protein BpHYR1_026325 [Brachionus plicatilis]
MSSNCVKIFSQIYEEHERLGHQSFSFNKMAEELVKSTPVKKINKDFLPYDHEDLSVFVLLCKDCIIRNLCLNSSFQKHAEFGIKFLKNLYNFLNQTIASEQSLAQSIFLIHNSKVDFQTNHKFIYDVLEKFSSIKISSLVEQYPIVFDELKSLFGKIVSNSFVQQTVNALIDELAKKDTVRKNNLDFDYENLNLKFIDSEYGTLYGYAGKNSIYVNTKPFIKILTRKNLETFSYDQKLTTIKLTFVCVIVHEIAHVVLRYRLNDMNKSSPFLKTQQKDADEGVLNNIAECGLACEKKFFKEAIDWVVSMRNQNLNFGYLNQLLKDIEQGRTFDFDTSMTKFVTFDETQLVRMACYFRPKKEIFYY